MIERVRNVIKADHKKGKRPAPGQTPISSKRRKSGDKLLNRYPILLLIWICHHQRIWRV